MCVNPFWKFSKCCEVIRLLPWWTTFLPTDDLPIMNSPSYVGLSFLVLDDFMDELEMFRFLVHYQNSIIRRKKWIQGNIPLDKETEGIDTPIKNPKMIPKHNTSKTNIQFFFLLYINLCNPSSRSYLQSTMVHPLCWLKKKKWKPGPSMFSDWGNMGEL